MSKSKIILIVSIIAFVLVAIWLAVMFSRNNTSSGWWSVEFAQPDNSENHDFIITNTNLTTPFSYSITTIDSGGLETVQVQDTVTIAPKSEAVLEPQITINPVTNQVLITVTNDNEEQNIFKNIE